MKIADLFCGAGGAGMGLHRAGFEVIGFDIEPQKNYPFEFHLQDALKVDLSGFDAVWANPPCQRYSVLTPSQYPPNVHRENHPDLIDATRALLRSSELPYIIENVPGAKRILRDPIRLCGSSFGLLLQRHRFFEVPWMLFGFLPVCMHPKVSIVVSGRSNRKVNGKRTSGDGIEMKRIAMGIDWMTGKELTQAIPPVYSEYLGKQFLQYLELAI